MISKIECSMLVLVFLVSLAGSVQADEPSTAVEGTFTANGEKVELPYAYVYAEEEGFYDESDPTWTLLFVEHAIDERDLDDTIWDSAFIRLGITQTSEFDDEPTLQVYSQDIRFSGEDAGNVSGGSYPELTVTQAGPDRFAGRVHHAEVQEFFDDTFQYDLSFDLPLSDPNAPIGDPLPAGGGEPGVAFVGWCDAVHSDDMDRLKPYMTDDQIAMFETVDPDQIAEDLEMMKMMTPTEVEILGGSSDGQTAILDVEGTIGGETMRGEITMELMDGRWINTNSAWGE